MGEKICNCKIESNALATMPIAVHEASEERHARKEKCFFVVIILLIVLLVGSNIAWLVYQSQFETVEVSEDILVDAEGDGTANYIGQDGDIYNGED